MKRLTAAVLLCQPLLALLLILTPAAQGAELLHNYYTLREDTRDLAASYPNIARYQVSGSSANGLDIFTVEIAANISELSSAELAALPTMYVDGGHHGNELLSIEAGYYFLEGVLARAEADPAYIVGKRLVVTPVVNADGYSGDCRNNRNGVDLNRNYPYNWGLYGSSGTPSPCPASGTYRGASAGSEAETKVNMALMEGMNLYFYLSAHTGSYDLVLPWKTPYNSPDHEYAAEIPDWVLFSRYLDEAYNLSGMDSRDPSGSSESTSWAYGAQAAPSLIIEVSTSQWNPGSTTTAREETAAPLLNYYMAWENLTLLGGHLTVLEATDSQVTLLNDGWGVAYNVTVGGTTLASLDPGQTATLRLPGGGSGSDPALLDYQRLAVAPEGLPTNSSAIQLDLTPYLAEPESVSAPSLSGVVIMGVILAVALVGRARRRG